jgi:hypothetical protein
VKKTITIGKMGARQAKAKLGEIMSTINRADYVITSQINAGRFLDEYATMHVGRLAASTRAKYTNHIKNRIRPAFDKMMLCDIQPLIVQEWVNAKPLSWATRTDIRNIPSGIFTKAIEWGRWKDKNPIQNVHAGHKKAARKAEAHG